MNNMTPALYNSLENFLTNFPPGSSDLLNSNIRSSLGTITFPEISLHCSDNKCNGKRVYFTNDNCDLTIFNKNKPVFVSYICKNCSNSTKLFSLFLSLRDDNSVIIYKIGELPEFGLPTPTKLLNLLGKNQDYFLKGRRSENQNMGIGAFSYYRRILESLKDTLFDEIIKVAKMNYATVEQLESLTKEKQNFQFTTGLKNAKMWIPESLKLEGQNPMILLHEALSKGMHAKTDEENLAISQNIRVVLFSLAQRLADLLKDSSQLKNAIAALRK